MMDRLMSPCDETLKPGLTRPRAAPVRSMVRLSDFAALACAARVSQKAQADQSCSIRIAPGILRWS